MKKVIDGNAIVYCEGAFNTPNGKTAHGLVRFTERYNVLSVVDSNYAGKNAGDILDNKKNNIPIFENCEEAVEDAKRKNLIPEYLVVGIAPDGGRITETMREDIIKGLLLNLNIDSGLHDFLSDDVAISALAYDKGLKIRDIRKPPERSELHFFSSKIEEVDSLKLAILGTDSAIGKRTTAWIIVHGLRKENFKAEMIGTGQTAWMQGAKYGIVLDSLINDFVSGEIEHAVYSAWKNENPDVIVIEGQGSLMNPAYPGGFEIIAAGRPDYIILQHAPKRFEYDGFPGYKIHPLEKQIEAIEIISGKKVIAITINHENMNESEIVEECKKIEKNIKLPAFDVLINGSEELITIIKNYIR